MKEEGITQDNSPFYSAVLDEIQQSHKTRVHLFKQIEEKLGIPCISFFTSFVYPVSIEDTDADMIEGVLQNIDTSDGFALIINSPGGSGITAERIIKACREYSGTNSFKAIVPNKAKSAATMVCFGSEEIIMGPTSELGPVDPQLSYVEGDITKRYSVYDLVIGYENLFERAVNAEGNIQPYLQQLAHFDERDISQYRRELELSIDISIKSLSTGMMKSMKEEKIEESLQIFLTTEKTKKHGRPIFAEEAEACGLNINRLNKDKEIWKLIYELYTRTSNYVNGQVAKCVESKEHSYFINPPN